MPPTAVLGRKNPVSNTEPVVRPKRPFLETIEGNCHQERNVDIRIKARRVQYDSDDEESPSAEDRQRQVEEGNGISDSVTSNTVTLGRTHSLMGGLSQPEASQGISNVLTTWQTETVDGTNEDVSAKNNHVGREKVPPEAGSQGVGTVLRDWQKDNSNDHENGIVRLMEKLEKSDQPIQSQDWQLQTSPGRKKPMERNSIREMEPDSDTFMSTEVYLSSDSGKTAELSDETDSTNLKEKTERTTPQIDPSIYYSMPSQQSALQVETKVPPYSSPQLPKEKSIPLPDNTQRSVDLTSLASLPISDSQYFQQSHTLSQNCDLLIEAHQRLTKREREDQEQEIKVPVQYPHLPNNTSFSQEKTKSNFSNKELDKNPCTPPSIFSVKPRTITSARYKEAQPHEDRNHNLFKNVENDQAQNIARRAAFLVEQMKKNKSIEKQFLLQMAQRRENPRAGPATFPKSGSVIELGFYWGQYPPLEKILRNHMEEYYELSVNKCQSRAQQEFNNKLVSLVVHEAHEYGWTFNKDNFDPKKIRDRVRCFFKTHIQNAKKRMNTMIHNPLKKANAKALANHLDLIEKHYDDATKREKNRCTVESQVVNDPTGIEDAKDVDAAQVLALGFTRLSQDDQIDQV